MASLYRQPGSDNLWIRYTIDGKQIRKSTGTSDHGQAELQLREIDLLLQQRVQTGTVSQKLARAIQSQDVRPVALHTIFESRRKHVAERTRELYQSRDTRFLDWIRHNYPHVSILSQIDRNMVRSFLECLADGYNARTHNGYLRRLRSVFRCAVRDGFTLEDPTTEIALRAESESARRSFTEAELRQLFGSVTGHVRLLATVGLYAGAMRLSDIVSLTWSNVDMKADVIRWRMSKRRGKPMEIAIHPCLMAELKRARSSLASESSGSAEAQTHSARTTLETGSSLSPHIDGLARSRGGPLFPTFYKSHHRASEAFRKALVKAGLRKDNRLEISRRYRRKRRKKEEAERNGTGYIPEPPTKLQKAEIDFHSLRYNFVTILKSQGCPEAIARSIMGHSSVEVNAIYTHIDADSEKKWVTSLPDVVTAP